MPDKLRSVDPLLPLKPKVLHILLAVADGPRHGYSIMQEVAGAHRRPGAALARRRCTDCFANSKRLDLIVESDQRPAADEDDERRRYFALTPHGKRVLDAEVRRLEAIVNHARSSRALRKAAAHDERSLLRWCAGVTHSSSGAACATAGAACHPRRRRATAQRSRAGRVTLATTWFALLWDLVFVGARHDLAQALRALVRSPGVTVGISLLLGLGVAATTTLFAFVDAVLLRPLPYDQPDRLVMMWESNVSQDRLREGPSPGNVLDWVARNDAFDAITAMMTVSATLRGRDGGTPITGVHVTRGFFDVYRRQPRLGRTFHADEFEGAASITSRQASSGEPVIVLSHRLWQTLGADPQIVGRTVSRGRPRLARDWRHARRLRGARRGGGLLGAVGHAGVVPRRAFSERTPSRRPVPARRRPDESRDVHRRRRGADADAGERIGVRASGHERRLECSAVSARG